MPDWEVMDCLGGGVWGCLEGWVGVAVYVVEEPALSTGYGGFRKEARCILL